jgi:hypothetical protein
MNNAAIEEARKAHAEAVKQCHEIELRERELLKSALQINQASAETDKRVDGCELELIVIAIDQAAKGAVKLDRSAVEKIAHQQAEKHLFRAAYRHVTAILLPAQRIRKLRSEAEEMYAQAGLLRAQCLAERQRVAEAMAAISGVATVTVESAEYLTLAAKADELQREGARREGEAREQQEALNARVGKGI